MDVLFYNQAVFIQIILLFFLKIYIFVLPQAVAVACTVLGLSFAMFSQLAYCLSGMT